MPTYTSHVVFEIVQGVKAFLSLHAGITRGALPDYESKFKQPKRQQIQELGNGTYPAASRVNWIDDKNLKIGDSYFYLTAEPREYLKFRQNPDTFVVVKEKAMIEKLLEMTSVMEVRNIFELGILQGGSTALYHELFHPEKLVAIEHKTRPVVALDQLLERSDLSEVVKPFFGVDQSDQATMEKILEDNFPERNIDLVVDDASHLYDETKASFNVVFPFVRPGGLYLIEDWAWAHWAGKEWQEGGPYQGKPALSNLTYELTMLCASRPDLVSDILITSSMVFVRRGFGKLSQGSFDLSNHYLTRGKDFRPVM